MTKATTSLLSPAQSGDRLDHYLSQELAAVSRTRARELIVSGLVLVDGLEARPSHRVQAGQQIRVNVPAAAPTGLEPEAMPLELVYEDEDMVVVDKPAGLAVHPAPGHRQHTLVHGLLARFPDLPGIGGTVRPGIVHRLDLDTSGLLLVAKTERGHASLSSQFASRSICKGYLALLKGRLAQVRGLIDAPVGRDVSHRQQMAIVPHGRPARTRFVEIAPVANHSLLLAMPETGRTHQIRVHFASLGQPIAGDRLYGGAVSFLTRQFLHAALLRFARPSDGAAVELCSPLPADLRLGLVGLLEAESIPPESIDQRIGQMIQFSVQHFHRETI